MSVDTIMLTFLPSLFLILFLKTQYSKFSNFFFRVSQDRGRDLKIPLYVFVSYAIQVDPSTHFAGALILMDFALSAFSMLIWDIRKKLWSIQKGNFFEWKLNDKYESKSYLALRYSFKNYSFILESYCIFPIKDLMLNLKNACILYLSFFLVGCFELVLISLLREVLAPIYIYI